ncbi:MAG: hypothetical protein ACRD8Z_21885, partial [Nitrososphaeraceae archaeon]
MFVYQLSIQMRTVVAVAVMAILASIVATLSALAVTDNLVDARTTERVDSVAAGSSGDENAGSGFYTTVCGPDP